METTNEQKIGTLKKIFSEDISLFGKFFFPNHLSLETPAFHQEIYNELESPDLRIAIGAPRGHAKSNQYNHLPLLCRFFLSCQYV